MQGRTRLLGLQVKGPGKAVLKQLRRASCSWSCCWGADLKEKTSTATWTREHSAAYFFQNESSGTRSLCSWSVFHRLGLSRAFTLPTPAHVQRHHTRKNLVSPGGWL